MLLDSATRQRSKTVHRYQHALQPLGISRLARLTSLDRAGVEVVAAIRPDGHVLQVSNGKGETFEHAVRGAVMEAAELTFSERVPGTELTYKTADDLCSELGPEAVLGPRDWEGGDLLQSEMLWRPEVSIAWTRGVNLLTGHRLDVPACLVHCPPGEARWLGPLPLRWTTNGLAAHRTQAGAVQHALYELIERDTLARAFPEGLTSERILETCLAPSQLARAAPHAATWSERMKKQQLSLTFLDASSHGLTGLSVVAAILMDEEGGPVPITAGYACADSLDEASCRAFFEAAQSRLTDIQGAREDVGAMNSADVEAVHQAIAKAQRKRGKETRQRIRQSRAGLGLPRILQRLRKHGIARVALIHEKLMQGIHVARIIAPGLHLSELL